MKVTEFKFSTEVNVNDISNIISKNYGYVMTEFLELQRGWLFRAYSTFKDLDKYLILMSLVDKTFKSYSEYLIKYDYEKFYSVKSYEIKKFNILNVAKELSISKETARRKILEMEKQGLIIKNKKAVFMQRDAYNIQRPTDSIIQISRFMSILSRLLKKNKIVYNEISTNDFEILIKKNFTQCWSYFLSFQIEYLTTFKKKFFGDYESLSIWAMIVYNQNLYFNKKINKIDNSIVKEKYLKMLILLKESLGLNAMSISDLTGIPRPTVLRKLKKLIKTKWISKDKKSLYKISPSEKNYKDLDLIRYENINKLSHMVSKFYNTARLYNN
tara:strand:- start:15 stop:998 length:984 start_codon:yes stop_codon:yes gene_type:complete